MRQSPTGKGPKVYGNGTKRCNCPIHKGAQVPLDQFWVFKKGKRKGMPLSKCIAGIKLLKGRTPDRSGFVPVHRVKFIFEELEARIGRTEACRRIGASCNFYWRLDQGIYKNMRKETVATAMAVLKACRERDEVRNRFSIKHGAAARGKKERPRPVHRREFNVQKFDVESERRTKYRREHETSEGLTDQAA